MESPLKLKFANHFIIYQKCPFRGHSELCAWGVKSYDPDFGFIRYVYGFYSIRILNHIWRLRRSFAFQMTLYQIIFGKKLSDSLRPIYRYNLGNNAAVCLNCLDFWLLVLLKWRIGLTSIYHVLPVRFELQISWSITLTLDFKYA